jgi:PAS domain S-box-containing protein
MPAPLPPNEAERLKALQRYDILDTVPEQEFDDITLLASHICGTPIALISLVDEDRQWFKSRIGVTISETPRDVAFCAHGILQSEVFIVPDAQADPRFADNPMVTGEAHIRFYAGAPLITSDGHALGMLCVKDQVPREMTPAQKAALQALSRQVVTQLELRRNLVERQRSEQILRQLQHRQQLIFNSITEGLHWVDLQGRIVFENPASARMLGWEKAELIGRPAHLTMHHTRADGSPYPQSECPIYEGLRTGVTHHVETEMFWRQDGTGFPVEYTATPVREENGEIIGTVVVFTDSTARKQAEADLKKAHQELVQASRQAGMAEVATSMLHNVGNVLNSVSVASSCLATNLRKSKAANLLKVATMLQEHQGDLGTFLANDPKGQQVPNYLMQLAEHLAAEQTVALKELAQLQKNIEHIKDIVSMQQSYAKASGRVEKLQMADLVEDALQMNSSSLARHDIQIIKEFADVPPVTVEKHKVLQILVNLIRNAKQACDELNGAEKRLTLRVTSGSGRVCVMVSDSGVGIPQENLTRIFSYGFTTRQDGHGFGLLIERHERGPRPGGDVHPGVALSL